jgi:hypothetical protein
MVTLGIDYVSFYCNFSWLHGFMVTLASSYIEYSYIGSKLVVEGFAASEA